MRPIHLPFLGLLAALTTLSGATPRREDGNHFFLGDRKYRVELAITPQEQARGLMGRVQLPEDYGMLFVLPSTQYTSVWMKDVLIPLDILFLDERKRLVRHYPNLPPCRKDPCPIYRSGAPAKYILEVNAGQSPSIESMTTP